MTLSIFDFNDINANEEKFYEWSHDLHEERADVEQEQKEELVIKKADAAIAHPNAMMVNFERALLT